MLHKVRVDFVQALVKLLRIHHGPHLSALLLLSLSGTEGGGQGSPHRHSLLVETLCDATDNDSARRDEGKIFGYRFAVGVGVVVMSWPKSKRGAGQAKAKRQTPPQNKRCFGASEQLFWRDRAWTHPRSPTLFWPHSGPLSPCLAKVIGAQRFEHLKIRYSFLSPSTHFCHPVLISPSPLHICKKN